MTRGAAEVMDDEDSTASVKSYSRREMLALTSLACGQAAPDPRTAALDSLLREVDAAGRGRFEAMAAIRTRSQVAGLQERVRRVMNAAVGLLPNRTPLNVRPVGQLTRGDYVIEKIICESR